MPVIVRQRLDHAVLHRVEVLELVHEDHVPLPANSLRVVGTLQQFGRLDHQHVKIHHVPVGQVTLVLVEQHHVVVKHGIAAEPVRGEPAQRVAMPAAISFNATQHRALVVIVGDAESGIEADQRSVFAEEFGAERVDGAARDLAGWRTEPRFEAVFYLSGGLVGERERADPRRIHVVVLDQVADALDKAERLARARSCQHEQRAHSGLDGRALRW